AGTTLTGQVLSPQSVRKLACDAAIIPMVLGSQGQPLDVGRTKRLVTPALLAALWARDKGCTFPGCGRPPQWCDAHHVRHWVDGGATSLLNLALLCAYHHTWVHQRDLTAAITALGATWQT
ncbi:MAG: HNH endonuclease signature motif containing protein, partial [Dermatophilaceae bacterium]